MSASTRLEELGITLPTVVPPLAAYVPAVVSGSHVFVSGQLPMVDGSLVASGKVGADVDAEEAAALARICALNGIAAAVSVIGDVDRIVRIVKLTGFVNSAAGFTGQPAVINGGSNVLGEIFGDAGKHARSAVGVSELPLGSPVEVELIVEFA